MSNFEDVNSYDNITNNNITNNPVVIVNNHDLVGGFVRRSVSLSLRSNDAHLTVRDNDGRPDVKGMFFSLEDAIAIRDFLNEHLITDFAGPKVI